MAKVRVEWVRLARADFERGGGGLATVIGAQTITASSTPVTSTAAPAFAANAEGQDGFARVSGLSGAVNLAWGTSPIASEANGVRLEAGAQILIAISTGSSLSIVEAVDAPAAASMTDVTAETTLAAIQTTLGGGLTVTGPLTNAQLVALGLATAAKQDTGNTALSAIQTALGGSLSVTGPLTNAQLVALGVATAAKQDAGNTTLSAIQTALGGTLDVQTHPLRAEATSRSGLITAGGTAQDLMPANAARKGWRIQNQSSAPLYVRSKGADGSVIATADQNSLRIEAGVIWTEDGHVTVNALSVLGATTGQAFYAREW